MSDNVLSGKKLQALTALMAGKSMGATATAAGVSERTLSRWMDEPVFFAELRAAEHQAIDAAARRIVGLVDSAVSVIEQVMTNPTSSASTRYRAAAVLLDSMLKIREVVTLEDRIAALEQVATANAKADT